MSKRSLARVLGKTAVQVAAMLVLLFPPGPVAPAVMAAREAVGGVAHAWWSWVYDACGGGFVCQAAVVPWASTTAMFWGFGLLLLSLDVFTPKWSRKYKVQPGTNEPITGALVAKVARRALYNQFAVLPLVYVSVLFARWRGMEVHPDALPGLGTALWQLLVCVVTEEVGFYYSHRLFHEVGYARFHKIHHELTAPVAIGAIYAHELEHLVANVLPLVVGPVLAGTHIAVLVFWQTFAVWTTLISHGGYHFPFLPSPEAHDYHHAYFNVNYGVMGWLDSLHGTNEKFVGTNQAKRHFILTGLKSAREVIPDAKD